MSFGKYLSLDAARAIYAEVSAETGISVDRLLSESRNAEIVHGKRLVMRRMRDRGASFPMIGTRMGLDHTTVQYGLRKLAEAGQ